MPMNYQTRRTHRAAMAWLLAIAAGACSGDEWSVLSSRDSDPRYEAIRRRMAVTVVDDAGGALTTSEVDPEDLPLGTIDAECGLQALVCTGSPTCTVQRSCISRNLCIAQYLMRIVQSPTATPFDTLPGQIVTYVPPQDHETNVALAELAAQYADSAALHADAAIGLSCSGSLTMPGSPPPPPGTPNDIGTELAMFWVEAFNLRVEAADEMERAALAVSDAAFANNSSATDSANLSLSAYYVSRSHIAHHLVGGEEGMRGMGAEVDAAGFCPDERLSADAVRALELIRQAGPPAAIVRNIHSPTNMSGLTLDAFLTSWGTDASTQPGLQPDSLRYRWSVLNEDSTMATLTASQLQTRFGVSEQGFLDARAYLAHELAAFDRINTVIAPPDPLGGGADTSTFFDIHAATRVPPTPPLALYSATVAAYDANSPAGGQTNPWTTPSLLPTVSARGYTVQGDYLSIAEHADIMDLGRYYDGALSRMSLRLTAANFAMSGGDEVLSSHIGAMRDVAAGRMQVCVYTTTAAQTRQQAILDIRIFDAAPSSTGLRVVWGRAGLDCAVRGAVDGVPCDLANYTVPVEAAHPWTLTTVATTTGYTRMMRAGVRAANVPRSAAEPTASQLFVVRAPIGDATPGPGEYEPVGGVMIRVTTTGLVETLYAYSSGKNYHHCASTEIAPELWERASDAIAADPAFCGRPRADCAGMPDLIPLENELTSDGDAVESSWRHYLAIARNAADEADRLGEEVIRNGLDMDLRAEAAVDELEDICGVSINVNPVADPPAPTNGACVSGTCPGTCNGQPCYVCSGDMCVLDPILYATSLASSADAQRLADCLGENSEVRYTALGNRHMCVWDYGVGGTTCAGANEDGVPSCPWEPDTAPSIVAGEPVPPPTTACSSITGVPATLPGVPGSARTFYVSDRLGLFTLPDEGEPGAESGTRSEIEYPCRALARQRAGESREGAPAHTSEFFELSTLAAAAQRLSWYPIAGDVSRVTWDGTSIISTGATDGSTPMDWPCAGPPPMGMPAAGMGALCPIAPTADPSDPSAPPLSCFQTVCGTRESRARMNDMLARAVMAVRLVSGVGLAGVRVPYYPDARDPSIRLQPEVGGGGEGWEVGVGRPSSSYFFQRATSGAVGVNGSLSQDYGIYAVPLSEMDARAERIYPNSGSCWTLPDDVSSVEWTNCPYDGGSCLEIFDDGPDFDDCVAGAPYVGTWDRDMPMLVRTLGALEGSATSTFVTRLWASGGRRGEYPTDISYYVGRGRDPIVTAALSDTRRLFLPAELGFFPYDPYRASGGLNFPLSYLTSYFRRSVCGIAGGGLCEGRSNATIIGDAAACYGGSCEYVGCEDEYFQCGATAEIHGLDFPSLRDGNRAFIAPRGFTYQDMLNGFELLCYAAATSPEGGEDPSTPGAGECGTTAPAVTRLADLGRAERFLTCQGNAIRAGAARTVVRGLPQRVIDAVRGAGPGVAGDSSGEFAAASLEIAAAYTALRDVETNIGLTVDGLASETSLLRNAIGRSAYANQIEDLSLQSQIWDRMTSCVVSAAEISENGVVGLAGGIASAAATCTNAAVQTGLATRIRDIRGAISELDTQDAFIRFDARVAELSASLSRESVGLQAALQRVDAALARLEALQNRGRRALARALFLDDEATGRHMAVDTVMRARYNTGLYRYRESHERAVRLAYIARLALEQRLGMPLDTMDEDLVTVEAPASWADTICGLPSIDYDTIAAGELGMTGEREGDSSEFMVPDGYSGAYVGDYVRRLEQVFESYNFAYPFQDGTDVAVLSLRDEIHGIREACEVDGPNLLYQSNHLERRPTDDAGGWEMTGCTTLPAACPAGATTPAGCWPDASITDAILPVADRRPPTCITVGESPSTVMSPLSPETSEFGRPPAQRITFGGPAVNIDLVAPVGAEAYYGAQPGARLIQWVWVPGGRYRLSAYERVVASPPSGARAMDPTSADMGTWLGAVRMTSIVSDGSGMPVSWVEEPVVFQEQQKVYVDDGWQRHHGFIDVPGGTYVGIYLDPNFEATAVDYAVLDVAGVMLEDVTDAVTGSVSAAASAANPPGPYFDTTDTRTRMLPVCEDTDGSRFRERSWSYGCVSVCPDGYDGSCAAIDAENRCYYETSFSASSDTLERLAGRASAGFAAGSYNYRIESIGLNLVGTGLRDCEGFPGTPSTCYASGNTAYSIIHNGPFLVRNARGELYNAPIFTGRIENARALAAERYLTNPLSGADRGLIESYNRIEMRGRPLGGSLTLRIWDDAAFRFDRLEDVQIVLGYRYWTRQR